MICCSLLQMVLVIIFIIAVIMYRVLIAIPLFQNNELRSKAMMIASGSAAVVNLILIMALGKVYEKLALKLTQWGKGALTLSERELEILHCRHFFSSESDFTWTFAQCRCIISTFGFTAFEILENHPVILCLRLETLTESEK